MKKCTGPCNKEKELKDFNHLAKSPDERAYECKECCRLRNKAAYKAKRPRRLEMARSYKARNKEKVKVARLLSKARDNITGKAWREKNREKLAAYKREYFQKYPEKRPKHKDLCAQNPHFRIRHNLRARLRNAMKGLYKSGSAVAMLGISIDEFFKYIELLWKPGMSWNNYGRDGWHIDHIRPLISFDLSKSDEIKIACHYTNLQPLWQFDNLCKNGHYDQSYGSTN